MNKQMVKAELDKKVKEIREEEIVIEPEFDKLEFAEQIKLVDAKLTASAEKGKDFQEAFKELSPQEQNVVYKFREYEAQRKAEQEADKERIRLEEREKLRQEYDAASPDMKMDADVQGTSVSPSGLQQWLKKSGIDRKKKKSYKKGLSVIIKCNIGRGYEIITSKKPVRYVEFKSKNEKGEEVTNITRITKSKGHLNGSSIPVHFCIEGVANSYDPFENIETNMSAEYFNKLLQGEFQAGLSVGLAIKPEGAGKFDMAKITPILLLGVVAGLGVIAYYQMQLYEMVSALGA